MNIRITPSLFVTIITIWFALFAQAAHAYEPPRSALMIDVKNNQILFDEASREIRQPASLTKMMTLYLVFEALREKKITLHTPVVGSRHSADRPPSRLGLAKDESITVDLAIDALVVRSANDVAAALGELLGGTEEQFAELMTVKARQLGMKDTVYRNASGLPNKEQVTTATDQARLGLALKFNFPEYYPRFSVATVTYKDRTWNTHNNLLKNITTVTGIKTGFINASGFNIVTYAEEASGDKIIVVMGGRSAKERDRIVIDLLQGRKPAHLITEEERIARADQLAKEKAAEKLAAAKEAEAEKALVAEKEAQDAAEQAAKIVVENQTVTATASAEVQVASVEPETQTATDAIKPYAIQVGALPSIERANERLALARPALGNAADTLRQYTLPLDTSRGTVFRARIIGFDNMKAAFDACAVMEANKIECMALIQR